MTRLIETLVKSTGKDTYKCYFLHRGVVILSLILIYQWVQTILAYNYDRPCDLYYTQSLNTK